VLLAVALLLAAPADPGPPRGMTTELGAAASYTLRLSGDRRSHGLGAHVWGDLPLVSDFGLRAGGLAASWAPSDQTRRPLSLAAFELDVVYALDDLEERVLVNVGVFGGMAWDGEVQSAPHAGISLGLGLRFPLSPRLALAIDARLPYHLISPEGLTLRGLGGGPPSPLFPFEPHALLGIAWTPF
jgi:hypothetical protein